MSFRHEHVAEEGVHRMHAHFLYDQNELINVTFKNVENGSEIGFVLFGIL